MPTGTTQHSEFQLAVLRLISGGLAIGMLVAGIFSMFDPAWVRYLVLAASLACALFTAALNWIRAWSIAVVRIVLLALMVTLFVGSLSIQPTGLGALAALLFLGMAVGVAAYEVTLPAVFLALAAVGFGVLSIALRSSIPEAATGVFIGVAAACLFAVFGFRRVAASATAAAVADSVKDPLTGITNRRGLALGTSLLSAIAQRSGQLLGCLIMDLDYFKKVNDEHGHEAGDRVLVAAADRIRQIARQGDLFVRVGGDEFALFTVVSSEAELYEIAERLRVAVEEAKTEPPVTVSVGGALRDPSTSLRIEDLMQAADRELYAAKMGGRNAVRIVGAQV